MTRPGLFSQVVIATILGILTGLYLPSYAPDVSWLTDLFLKPIIMAVGPLLFCIVTLGIIGAGSLRTVGRLGGRALLYFEGMTTVVLIASVAITLFLGAGTGLHFSPSPNDTNTIASYSVHARHLHDSGISGFLLSLIPHTPISAFADGNVLQILLVAILSGCCLNQMGEKATPIISLLESLSTLFSYMMRIIIKLAPLGVFGAMATTTSRYGLGAITHLAGFVLLYFLMIAAFIILGLGTCIKLCGLSPLRFAQYFREEIAIVATTTTSDAVLPRLMEKLEKLGIDRQVVGLVVPAGYSFNLDALSIYLGLAIIFLANATGTALTMLQIITMLATALITSKGAHGVPGVAIVVLAATLASIPSIPTGSLVLLLAVDWFIGIARALGNFAGNCVAPVVIGRWEKKLDLAQARKILST